MPNLMLVQWSDENRKVVDSVACTDAELDEVMHEVEQKGKQPYKLG